MKDKKYIATVKDSRQYTEDMWEPVLRAKEVNRNTTLGELIDWQKEIWKRNNLIQEGIINQIYISVLDD